MIEVVVEDKEAPTTITYIYIPFDLQSGKRPSPKFSVGRYHDVLALETEPKGSPIQPITAYWTLCPPLSKPKLPEISTVASPILALQILLHRKAHRQNYCIGNTELVYRAY